MPISVPPIPQLDYRVQAQFDPNQISSIGDALLQAQASRKKNRSEAATRSALQNGPPMRPDGTLDTGAMAAEVLRRGGDIDTALALTRLAETQAQNAWQQQQPIRVGGALVDPSNYQPVYEEPPKPASDAGYTLNPGDVRYGQDNQPVASVPASPQPQRSRVLPQNSINALTGAGATAADFDRLVGTWKDEFGGKYAGPVGEAENLIGRNIGAGYGDQANWWQDYQTQKNLVRNKLFGSALTATEKGEFEKANISPGMTPEIIRQNLQRQQMIANRAAKKLAAIYIKQGYSPDVIEAAIGVPLGDLGVTGPQGATQQQSEGDLVAKPAAPAAPTQTPQAPTNQARPRATNPQTGETIEWNGQAWVPVQ